MAPNLRKKKHKDVFFEVTPKKIVKISVGEALQAKFAQKLFGQTWGNSFKNVSHRQIFAYSYTY